METLPKRAYHWLIRTKLYHLPFWIIYQLFWGIIFYRSEVFTLIGLEYILMYTLTEAVGAYFNVYYLIPTLLRRKKYGAYLLALGANIVVTSGLVALGIFLISYQIAGEWVSVEQMVYVYGSPGALIGATFSSAATAIFVVMIVTLGKEWLNEQTKNQRLEKEKLETELKFLRSQFNPHFLFNTINSIFFLIQQDPPRATQALAAFSDIMRYQLYECNEATISLKKEVHYLTSFVALEKLRKGDRVAIELSVCENLNGSRIAPFILMPFVENAFKHVSGTTEQGKRIRISLQQHEGRLHFAVHNTKEAFPEPTPAEMVSYGGIGLTNVRRRLALLYPDQHQLAIEEQPDAYSVNLTINLHEN